MTERQFPADDEVRSSGWSGAEQSIERSPGYYAAQRARDNEPCSVCGGDRLRADFTGSGRCHVSLPTAGISIIAGAASPEPSEGTK